MILRFFLSYEVLCHPSTSASYCSLYNHLEINRAGVLVPKVLHKLAGAYDVHKTRISLQSFSVKS